MIAVDRLSPDATPLSCPRHRRLPRWVRTQRRGTAVRLKAALRPPPEPVEPGGFDFARQAWFARLGGTGYATSKVGKLAEDGREPPWDIAAWAAIDRLRVAINHCIRAALPGETGEIAVALITGERGGISQETKQAMRNSGLAHILSISGLHMVIMAGTVFWLTRALLALFPYLALRFPIRKWAAAAALAAARRSICCCPALPCRRSAPGS